MDVVPVQREGGKSDNDYRINCKTEQETKELYATGCRNLFAVNNWGHITDSLLAAEFILHDESGQPVNRLPTKNDYIRIDIPGPGSMVGEGYDWVRIEEIGHGSDIANEIEYTFFRVRPSNPPDQEQTETAHFFSAQANSTFLINRSGKTVISEIHGRNEKPNTTSIHDLDKVRNSLVATLAIAIFSDAQWKALCKAFLTYGRD